MQRISVHSFAPVVCLLLLLLIMTKTINYRYKSLILIRNNFILFFYSAQCQSIFNPQPGNCTDELVENFHFVKSENECMQIEQLPCGSQGFQTKGECQSACIGKYKIMNCILPVNSRQSLKKMGPCSFLVRVPDDSIRLSSKFKKLFPLQIICLKVTWSFEPKIVLSMRCFII